MIGKILEDLSFGEAIESPKAAEKEGPSHLSHGDIADKIRELEVEMKRAAKELRFEDAAHFRDELNHYKKLELI